VFDSDVEHVSFLISLLARNMIFFHFKFLQANLRSGKRSLFMAGLGQYFASLRRCS